MNAGALDALAITADANPVRRVPSNAIGRRSATFGISRDLTEFFSNCGKLKFNNLIYQEFATFCNILIHYYVRAPKGELRGEKCIFASVVIGQPVFSKAAGAAGAGADADGVRAPLRTGSPQQK